MSRRLLTVAATAAVLAVSALAGATPGRAEANAPVCGTFYDLGGSYTDCYYYNYAQCRAAISGRAGTCEDNLTYRESLNRMPQRPRTRR